MDLEIAYIYAMAVLSVVFGAFSSVRHHKEQMASYNETGERSDIMSNMDAVLFPIKAYGVLVALHFLILKLSREVNFVVNIVVLSLETLVLSHLLSPMITELVPEGIPNSPLDFYAFTTDIITLGFCILLRDLYIVKKYWILNNLFAIGFAVYLIEVLHLNDVVTGSIFLGGLAIYDTVLFFETDVMDTVVMLDAPVKLVLPQYDFVWDMAQAFFFAGLGLGDVVVPGIFIALQLRFDNSLDRGSRTYFKTSILGSFVGIVLYHLAARYRSQPGLLYLIPCCVGAPLLLAFLKGDMEAMLEYEDYPSN